MLELLLPETDEFPMAFVQFEHSLLSVSKWEFIHEKKFFDIFGGTGTIPKEIFVTYIDAMLLSEDPPAGYLSRISDEQIEALNQYMIKPATATTFSDDSEKGSTSQSMTSELLYYWLAHFRIPFQPTETWHLNRVLTLVRIAGIQNTPPKKVDKRRMAQNYRNLNEQRRQSMGTNG